jgi:hypothetical protein
VLAVEVGSRNRGDEELGAIGACRRAQTAVSKPTSP